MGRYLSTTARRLRSAARPNVRPKAGANTPRAGGSILQGAGGGAGDARGAVTLNDAVLSGAAVGVASASIGIDAVEADERAAARVDHGGAARAGTQAIAVETAAAGHAMRGLAAENAGGL